jgi:hypothetical protein
MKMAKPAKNSTPKPEDSITVNLKAGKDQLRILRAAFPEIGNSEKIVYEIADLMFCEAVDLLAGKKRYLTLSHQYIEWIEQIHSRLLPDKEYTYDRIANQFQFPPGSAGYMTRVLRSRQNNTIHTKSIANLKKKLEEKKKIYKAEKQSDQSRVDIRLTHREHDILRTTVDSILEKDPTSTVQHPQPGSGGSSPMFVGVFIIAGQIQDMLDELNNKYGGLQ